MRKFSQGKPVFTTGNPVLIAGILFSLQGFPCEASVLPCKGLQCIAMIAVQKDKLSKQIISKKFPLCIGLQLPLRGDGRAGSERGQ